MKRENRVRTIRKILGYNDNEIGAFAERYNTTVEHVILCENQEAIPSYEFANLVSAAKNLPLEFIYGYRLKIGKNHSEETARLRLDGDWEEAERNGTIDYIKYKSCKCTFTRKFKLSDNLGAICSESDLNYALFNGHISDADAILIRQLIKKNI